MAPGLSVNKKLRSDNFRIARDTSTGRVADAHPRGMRFLADRT